MERHRTDLPRPPAFRRTISLIARAGRVDGRVEDNVHDFSVAITHDEGRVQAIAGLAHRVPWVTCPQAVSALDSLVGAPLAGNGPRIDASRQCTHLFDLARLAIAQASRGGDRHYDIDIAPEMEEGCGRARLRRDGDVVLDWQVERDAVTMGGPFAGHKTSGRAIWPEGVTLNANLVEAALILRRCLLVFWGRRRANADVQRASDLPGMIGVCFSFQPERSQAAVRPAGFRDDLDWTSGNSTR